LGARGNKGFPERQALGHFYEEIAPCSVRFVNLLCNRVDGWAVESLKFSAESVGQGSLDCVPNDVASLAPKKNGLQFIEILKGFPTRDLTGGVDPIGVIIVSGSSPRRLIV
jgi:hypothetical protein